MLGDGELVVNLAETTNATGQVGLSNPERDVHVSVIVTDTQVRLIARTSSGGVNQELAMYQDTTPAGAVPTGSGWFGATTIFAAYVSYANSDDTDWRRVGNSIVSE